MQHSSNHHPGRPVALFKWPVLPALSVIAGQRAVCDRAANSCQQVLEPALEPFGIERHSSALLKPNHYADHRPTCGWPACMFWSLRLRTSCCTAQHRPCLHY